MNKIVTILAVLGISLTVPGCRQAGETKTPNNNAVSVQANVAKEVPRFVQAPSIRRQGTGFTISFSVNTPCDATVAVLDKNGRVVRHLASGVLGPNAPEPFKKNSLAQEIEWDGRDDIGEQLTVNSKQSQEAATADVSAVASSKAAHRSLSTVYPAPYSIRVQLGLRPVFKRMLFEQPQGLSKRGPLGLTVGKDGLLYVEEGDAYVLENGLAGALQKLNVKVFDGDGNYLRSLVPFPGHRAPEEVSEVQFLTTRDGRRIPLALTGGNFSYGGFLPGASKTVRNTPLITSDGKMIYPCGNPVHGKRRFLVLGIDGSARKETFAGPPLQSEAKACAQIFMALSPDEKYLYFAGARSKREKGSALGHAVYRTTLDSQDFAKAFIGREFEPGNAEGQFNDPRGVDVDSKGRIWVCDYMNDRIQVFSADAGFLKSFEIRGPDQVRVHPKTGAVYVISVRDRGTTSSGWSVTWENYEDKSIVKFKSFDEWKETARLDLPKRKSSMHDPGPLLALDAVRNELVIWIAHFGRSDDNDFIWRVADRDGRLVQVPHKMVRLAGHGGGAPAIAADRRNNELIVGDSLLDPATGQMRKLNLAGKAGKAALAEVSDIAAGPDSLIYYRSAVSLPNIEKIWRIRRFDRNGQLVPFSKANPPHLGQGEPPTEFVAGECIEANANRAITAFNMHAAPFTVGPDGKVYVVSAASREHREVRVDVYGPDGDLVKPGLITMTKSGGCIRLDRSGRMWASDTIRPKGLSMPEWYTSDPLGGLTRWYGTVFRCDPAGGGVSPANEASATHMAGGMEEKLKPVTVKGALWSFHGLAPMPLQTGCQCVMTGTRFDADDWGRVWVPDAPGYCVAAVDSAGNLITRFGAYGNRDATGAGGAVPAPPIPFWYPNQTAALDNDVFVGDMLAGRIVQVHLAYETEAAVQVP